MSNASEILVIILSVFLAIFLLLSIVLTILLIRVTRQIKTVTTTAQSAVESINRVALNASKISSPAIIGKFVYEQIKKFRQ